MSRIGLTTRKATAQRRGGFTLIELILVMALLALSAAMVVPSLTKFAHHRRAFDAATDVLALTRFAHDQAACDGVPYRVCVDPVSRAYWVEAQRSGTFVQLTTSLGRAVSLPDGVTAAWQPSEGSTSKNAAPNNYAEFDPDGGHDSAVLRLIDRDNNGFKIDGELPAEPFQLSSITAGREVMP